MYLDAPTLGQPQKPVELDIGPAFFVWKLPRLVCTAAQLEKVSAIVGRPMTKDDVRAAILEAGKKGQDLGNDAWFKLHKKTLPADVERLFAASFGVAPTARPTSGATIHHIVVARYEGAISKLGDDNVNVSCWGWPWGGLSAKDEPENYFAKHVPRRFGIGLGRKFWAAVRDGDSLATAAVMLAMGLGIFYYRIRPGGTSPRTVRAQCYLRFAILAGGQTVPGWLESKCTPA